MYSGSPTLLGFNVFWVATMLAAVAVMAMLFALYTVMTVRDPMAGRVKALNERREQLKAGIVATSGKRRAKLNQKNETTDKMRSFLSSLQVLQESQLKAAQTMLVQAGYRSRDLPVTVIFARMLLPIVIGGGVLIAVYGFGWKEDWTPLKRFMLIAGSLIGSYKAHDIFL
jgi:tight adherence protein C